MTADRVDALWLFGYGSLIFRPGLAFAERSSAQLDGWSRRFWQGSHDHRDMPEAPGRVVTLVAAPGERCHGIAYRLPTGDRRAQIAYLDHREQNGYRRIEAPVALADGRRVDSIVYVAAADNHAFLGPAPLPEMAAHIQRSSGPSGRNRDYLFDLAQALREIAADDAHVFALERAVRNLE